MKRTVLLLLGMLFLWTFQVNAQWSIDAVETDYTIDFETTVSDVNEGTFDGSGFAITPATGQLDADGWAVFGLSDGDKDFGDEESTGDFARGTSTGGETTGGLYSFDVVDTVNHVLGVQPSGSDFAPGWIGLKLQNNTGGIINSIDFSYDVWVYNDEDRSQTFNGEFSADGVSWFPDPELAFTTTEAADASPYWQKFTVSRTGPVGMDISDGQTIYVRWYSEDNGGSGSRDEIAIDDITINVKYECPPITTFPLEEGFEGTYPADCWDTVYANTSYPAANEMSHTTDQAYEGTQSFRFSSFTSGSPYEQYLITPELDMSSGKVVEFWYRGYSSGSESFTVGTSTTGTDVSTDFTWETDVTDASTTWKKYSLSLDQAVKYVAIQYNSNYQYYLYVDDFAIRDVSSETDILSYSFPEQTGPANIDAGSHTIEVEVDFTADLADLVAEFTLSTGATAEVSGTTQESGVTANDFTSSVTYTVTAEDGSTTQDWVVDVMQAGAPEGANCDNPFLISLPDDLTYEDIGQTTCGLGNVYEDTDMGDYDGGEDAIYEITVTDDVIVDITLDPYSTSWSGIGLFESCPGDNLLIDEVSNSNSDPRVLEGILLTAGTYYIMVDIYPTPNCIDEYDLTIEEACPAPVNVDATDLTSSSALITWDAGGLETDWNLKVSSTSIDPTSETGDVFEGAVSTTPEQEVTSLTAETDYYVYVQADCDSDWTAEYTFTTPSACPQPTDVFASDIGSDNAELDWDAYGETEWVVKVSDSTIDPDTEDGTIVTADTTTDKPYTVSGLSPNTDYYFYVQSSCGSDWATEFMFTTECEAVTTFPWTEGFEDTWPPDCWTNSLWELSTYGDAHTGSEFAYTNEAGSQLTTPEIAIPAGTNMILEFYYRVESSSNPQDLNVNLSTDGTNFTESVAEFTDITNENYENYTYDLSAYEGQNIWVRFEGESGTGGPSFGALIDDVTIEEAPACPAVTDLAIDSFTSTEADVSWTETGSATSWNVIYGESGFDPATEGTTEAASAIPYTITDLTANTAYDVYVSADCGGGMLSDTVGPASFTTECEAVTTFPWIEDFEGSVPPECWEEIRTPSSSYGWISDTDGVTGNCAKFNSYFNTSGNVSELITLTLDISSLSSPVLDFTYKNPAGGDFTVLLSTDGGTTYPNTLFTDLTGTSSWTEMSADLSSYMGSDVKIAFVGTSNYGSGDAYIYLDDVTVQEAPACPAVTDLAIDSYTSTEADVSWTETGSATSWNVIYGESGFDPATEGTTEAASAIPHTISSLSPNTAYDVYVSADCGGGELSDTTGPESFTTECEAFTTFPWTEGFEDAWPPDCWTNSLWELSSYGDAHTGSEFAYTNEAGSQLTTPEIAIPAGTDMILEFYYRVESSSNPQDLNVNLSTDGTNFTEPVAEFTGITNENYEHYTYDLSAYEGQNIWVRFEGESGTGGLSYGALIDDVTIEEAPACPVVTDLAIDSYTTTEADVIWTETGSATSWNVIYGESGFDPATEGTTEAASAIPYTITDLTANTAYDVYVSADCGGGVLSDTVGPASFTTECEAVASFPWSEPFEDAWVGTPEAPECWKVVNGIDGSYWEQSTTQIYNGDYAARTYNGISSDYQADEWLITRAIDLDALSNPLLDFYGLSAETPEGVNADMRIMIMDAPYSDTTDLHANATEIDVVSFTESWENYSIDLSAYSGIKYIAFNYYVTEADNASFNWMYIDDVTVRELNTETDILTYSFPEQTTAADIDDVNHTVEVEVGNGTDLTALVADFTLSTGATAEVGGTVQESGVTANDFSSPVTYTVTAEDGTTTQDWEVTVTVADIYSEAEILEYSFPEETGPASIDTVANTVDIEVNFMADVTDLVAEFELSYGATAEVGGAVQESGVTANDFTDPVTYTITAEDGTTTQDYTVTVTVADAPLGANCDNPYVIELPAELTYEHLSQTTCGLGNVFEDTDLYSYDNGEDAIYEITVTEDVVVDITLNPMLTTYSGIGIFETCPDDNLLIEKESNSTSDPRVLEGILLTPGTYYLMIDSYASYTECIPEYDLTIEASCLPPEDVEATILSPTSADVTWTPLSMGDSWQLKVDTTSIDPTTDDGYIFDDEVTPDPEQSLTGLNPDSTYYVYVQDNCGSGWSTEYTFTMPSACPQPTDLFASAIGSDYAELDWTGYGETEWNIKVDTVSIDPASDPGEIVDELTTTKPYPASGLTPNTTYYFYVQSSCDSDWSPEGMFTTECEAFIPPFLEEFTTWFPECWSESEALLEDPIDLTTEPTSDWIDDDFANNTSNPQSARLNIYGTAKKDWLISPEIDLGDGSTSYQLEFDLALTDFANAAAPDTDGDDDVFAVVISTDGGVTWEEANVLRRWDNAGSPYVYNDISYTGEQVILDLTGYTNTVKIAFYGESTASNADNDLFVDNVEVVEIPACQAVINIAVENITSTSATVSWTEYGTATDWNVIYGESGFDPATEGTTEAASAIPYTITDLTAGTDYDVYVQADCGGGDLSDLTGPVSFNTALCDLADQCDYVFDLEDSYGDGWNGNYISVVQDGLEVAQITMDDGSAETIHQTLCDGFVTELIWHTGSYPYETSFTVYDPFDNVIVTGDGDSYTDGEVIHTFTSECTQLTDLALIEPTSGFDCELTIAESIYVEIENVGDATIPSGDSINFVLDNEGTILIDEYIYLSSDLAPGEIYDGFTDTEIDLAAVGTYLYEASITHLDDANPDNDTIDGYLVHFSQEVEFVDAVNDTISINSTDYPYTIQAEVVYTPDSTLTPAYLWGDGTTTTSDLTVSADDWYTLEVTTEGCTVEDSVYVASYNKLDSEHAAGLAIYPNPTEGDFIVDMTLAEKQDVVLTIINSSGQLVRNYKFDDVDQLRESIDLNDVAKGLYNLRINAGDTYYTRQIIVR